MWMHRVKNIDMFRSAHRPAFSLLEMLVVILTIAVLASMVLVSLSGSRRSAQSGACLSQLRQITMGLRHYAGDNNQVMPDRAETGVSWARSIQPYVGGNSVFACAADKEVFPLTGASYDWRDTGEPSTTMAGRRMESATRTSAVFTFESLPGWHAAKRINAGWIDGSTHIMDEVDCFKDLTRPIRAIVAAPP